MNNTSDFITNKAIVFPYSIYLKNEDTFSRIPWIL